MKLTEYFIRHKVSAIVLNLMILVIGFLCFKNISLREYPKVDIPVLSVSTHYPGASAKTIESSVTSILEDAVSGVSGIKLTQSESSQNQSSITVVFKDGTNIDKALIQLQSGINQAISRLPKDAGTPEIFMGAGGGGFPFFAISVTSTEFDFAELYHYTNRYIKNAFRSIDGVSEVQVWGAPYTMRVRLDPDKLETYGINVSDIISVLKKYSISLPVGKFRDAIPTTLDLELKDASDFDNTPIKENNGKVVYLKDIATTDLIPDGSIFRVHINGKPGLAISLVKTSDANPLEVTREARKVIQQMISTLPSHIKMNVSIDSSQFIQKSLDNIYQSIFEAIFFVLVVVYLFLRNFRATLIPLVTIPFSLIGAIAIMKLCGMSINTLTLLAMVMAIGLVVDDAIIVLENITRHIEDGMKPMDAAIKGSGEIAFAIIAMTLTLASVYAPIMFMQGVVADLFIEFAVALAGSVIISGIVALTLSPMMCSQILKSVHSKDEDTVNKLLAKLDSGYDKFLHAMLGRSKFIIAVIIGSIALIFLMLKLIPSELVPKEDRGMVGIYIPPIPGVTIDEMENHTNDMEKIVTKVSEGNEVLSFLGWWGSSTCLGLKDYKDRNKHQETIVNEVNSVVEKLPSIDAYTWSWNSGLPGLGESAMGGLSLTLVISTTGEYKELSKYTEEMVRKLNMSGKFMYVMHDVKFDTEGMDLIINRDRAADLQIDQTVVSDTVQAYFSGNKNLSFKKDDIFYSITIDTLNHPWSLNEIYVTSKSGQNIPVGSFAKLDSTISMAKLPHYNQQRAVSITASLFPSSNMEDTMEFMMTTAKEIFPESFKKEWTGAAEKSKEASGTSLLMFVMALVFIYAVLSVQFDNFIDPIIIILTVPLACSGALFATWIFGQSINIYTTIGIITLIGLITKHGILIVEFANKMIANGEKLEDAATHAAIMRLRPILMTTAAMVLGSIPLVLASGAGSESRKVIGIVLVGGLTIGTIFTLFVLPKIYCWMKKFTMHINRL
ncbi:MAG: hypothetical protein RLZZ59_781 [Pseudomonadota bacterium]|jgi:multidrug efflux pump